MPQSLLIDLVERFDDHKDEYHSGRYNETQLRRDYLDPFFEILGWDVANKLGYGEQYRDVIHEDAVKVEGKTKAPDYSFRVGGNRKFFVEAKKPSVNLQTDNAPAFQLRRYGWSAKLPLSILTDFEEWSVYDCRYEPHRHDRPTVARIQYFTYKDLPERFEELSSIFSKEAILKGSFDKYAESNKNKKGTAEVDSVFLTEIESWREMLAKSIALKNKNLSQREINFAVQRTIDRIIFLRISEDRGIETYGRLQELKKGKDVYPRLLDLFREADARYNSGIFHFHKERGQIEGPDELTTAIKVEDSVLKEMFRRLYYPESPYEFSVLSGSILGQVYEQFLGKVITLDNRHHATVESKPEVRKAGGVFYTPEYISRYIVETTIGKIIEGKTPEDVSKMRFLDPSCGSGSFLLVTLDYLLQWHLEWYTANSPESWAKKKNAPIYRVESSGSDSLPVYALTVGEKKKILLNNIYGVDIDSQAVEVTKLSLLLKVLEGETVQTLGSQTRIATERVLPDLGNNIKCGNSLIGPEFYDGTSFDSFTDEERIRVNAFDWNREFPEVMKNGGFDGIVGNPPYIRIQAMKEWAPLEVEHYKKRYVSASKGNYDIYVVFVEKGLDLLNPDGKLGYILPHKFFNAKYGEPLRGIIAKGGNLEKIVHFGDQQVFAGATTYTCLMFLSKGGVPEFEFQRIVNLREWRFASDVGIGMIKSDGVTPSDWNFAVGGMTDLFKRLSSFSVTLKDIAHTFVGTQTSADDVFVLNDCNVRNGYVTGYSKQLDKEVKVESGVTRHFLRGKDIRRYEPLLSSTRLICPYRIDDSACELLTPAEFKENYPLAFSYLEQNREKLEQREGGRFVGVNWYAFGYPKSMTLFSKSKLIVPDYNDVASCAFDDSGHFYKTGYGILVNNSQQSTKYVMGLLNSSLLFEYLRSVSTELRGGYIRFWSQYIEQLPIRMIDFSNPADKDRHDAMVAMVDTILTLHQRLAGITTSHDRNLLERQIEQTDRQINCLVYELYELTEEEIKVVEGMS